jgi:phage shock protein E
MTGLFKKLFGPGTDFKSLVNAGAIIADVRSPQEYKEGHIAGSKNYPLDVIGNKITELKKTGKPVITVCRSGARSEMAGSILQSAGIEVYNGGPWTSFQSKLS